MIKKLTSALLAFTFIISITGCSYFDDANYDSGTNITKLSLEDADATLNAWVQKLNPTIKDPPIDLDTRTDYIPEMPDINTEYAYTVTGKAANNAELRISTERSGSGNDGWLNRAAENFNKSNITTAAGQPVSVSIRAISSGTQLDYLTLTDIRPDAWSPASELWNDMALSKGIDSVLRTKRTAGNTAGILMKKSAYDTYKSKHSELNLKDLVKAVEDKELILGFTNPYAGSTALNMLAQILIAIDPQNPLGETAASEFNKFQATSPPPAFTTAQMRESAKKVLSTL